LVLYNKEYIKNNTIKAGKNMIETRGKFITLIASFLEIYKSDHEKLDNLIRQKTGKGLMELDPDGWYSMELQDMSIEAYRNASASQNLAYTTLGRSVYPTLNSLGAIPAHLQGNPLELIKFEAEGFKMSSRGEGIVPRNFVKAEEGEVIIEAVTPGLADKLMEGVFQGILKLCKVEEPKVERLENSTYRITWKR
jgi:hypothetical protein